MNSDVLISKTDVEDNYTTVFFTVPSLNIDSKIKVENDTFIKQVSSGGYRQLGVYLLKELDKGIQNLIRGSSDVSP